MSWDQRPHFSDPILLKMLKQCEFDGIFGFLVPEEGERENLCISVCAQHTDLA